MKTGNKLQKVSSGYHHEMENEMDEPKKILNGKSAMFNREDSGNRNCEKARDANPISSSHVLWQVTGSCLCHNCFH